MAAALHISRPVMTFTSFNTFFPDLDEPKEILQRFRHVSVEQDGRQSLPRLNGTFAIFTTNCDLNDLQNYLLKLQTAHLTLRAQFTQDQKIIGLSLYVHIFSEVRSHGVYL